jgi:hypothetical protein
MTLDAAEAIVRGQGFTPGDTSGWCDTCALHVIIAREVHLAGQSPEYAYFFTDHYLGTDTREASAGGPLLASRTSDIVTLRYAIYNSGDGACCPSGGTSDVRFRWDGQQLTALDPIPEHRIFFSGVVPSPGAAAPSADLFGECTWAVATLQEDARLDSGGATAYPAYAAYYTLWSGRWAQIADWVSRGCAPPWLAAQCATARQWVQFAISTHTSSGSTVPHDPQNDIRWTSNYARIETLLAQLCA